MKKLSYILIISIIAISQILYGQKSSVSNKILILQSDNNKATPDLLNQSSKIISSRLSTYGMKSFDIKPDIDKKLITVQLPDNVDLQEVEGLFTSSGELSFYVTLNLAALKNPDASSGSDARIGCSGFEDPEIRAKAEEYLRSQNLLSSTRLLWSQKNDRSQVCLFALKVSSNGQALMTRSDIEVIKSDSEKDSGSLKIGIKFKKEAAGKWEKATGDNINKPIAIVVGTKVFYTPVVRDAIVSGLCEITGNMTQKEVSYFLALVNNEPLPLSFKIKR